MNNSLLKTQVLIVLSLCSFLIGLDALIVSPLIPQIARFSGFNADMGGLLVTAYSLFYGLSAPLFGPLSDRVGRKTVAQTGMLLFAIGTILTALGGPLYILFIYRAVAGIGGAIIMPSLYAYIGDLFTYEERGKAMGIFMGAMSAASVLGIPIGSYLAGFWSWQLIFVGVGILAVITILLIRLILPKTEGNPSAKRGLLTLKPFAAAFSSWSVAFALLSTFMWWAGFQGLFANMGLFYFKSYNIGVDKIGLFFALAGVGSLVGSVIGGRIADRFGKKTVVISASLLSACAVYILPNITHHLPAAVIAHIVFAFGIGLGQSSITALISELNPSSRGVIMSLNSSATYLGMTASTSISVGILQFGGFTAVGLLCALLFLLVLPTIGYLTKEKLTSVEA